MTFESGGTRLGPRTKCPGLFHPKLAIPSNFWASGPGFATGKPVRVPLSTRPIKKSQLSAETFLLEGPVGLEPTTPCLKGRCSNQLSYGPVSESQTANKLRGLVFWNFRFKDPNNSLHYPDLSPKVNRTKT